MQYSAAFFGMSRMYVCTSTNQLVEQRHVASLCCKVKDVTAIRWICGISVCAFLQEQATKAAVVHSDGMQHWSSAIVVTRVYVACSADQGACNFNTTALKCCDQCCAPSEIGGIDVATGRCKQC
jgi:hypothetical protein